MLNLHHTPGPSTLDPSITNPRRDPLYPVNHTCAPPFLCLRSLEAAPGCCCNAALHSSSSRFSLLPPASGTPGTVPLIAPLKASCLRPAFCAYVNLALCPPSPAPVVSVFSLCTSRRNTRPVPIDVRTAHCTTRDKRRIVQATKPPSSPPCLAFKQSTLPCRSRSRHKGVQATRQLPQHPAQITGSLQTQSPRKMSGQKIRPQRHPHAIHLQDLLASAHCHRLPLPPPAN